MQSRSVQKPQQTTAFAIFIAFREALQTQFSGHL